MIQLHAYEYVRRQSTRIVRKNTIGSLITVRTTSTRIYEYKYNTVAVFTVKGRSTLLIVRVVRSNYILVRTIRTTYVSLL